jgi:outer membrane receptor for ferrienterochelin and colicin
MVRAKMWSSTKIHSLLILLLSLNLLYAGNTGKIFGTAKDKSDGELLIGVNVLLQGTVMGATTDLDGNYLILNVPPGIYTLEVQYIGYNTVIVQELAVSADLTTRRDIEMQPAVLEMEGEIVVVAERELIIKDLTSSTATIDAAEIQALPVQEISEVLTLQAGYVDGHVRGGRTGELAYWIDGVPVTDNYDRGQVVEVNKDMVEELQFISGAFNAEYGQAMSGIVNITTKEPREQFGGSLTLYAGDYVSSNDDLFWNTGNFNPTNIYNIDGSINGIIIPEKLSYYFFGRHINFNGHLYGRREYNPQNISLTLPDGEFIKHRDAEGKGDNEYVPMNWNRKTYAQAKLIYRINPMMKIFYSFIYDNVNFEEYDRDYRLNPDGNLNRVRGGMNHLLKYTHTLSNSTYYDIGISYFSKSYEQYAYEDPNDPRYVHPKVNDTQDLYSYKTGGTNNQHFKRESKTSLIKFDMTSQVSMRHLLKFGVEARIHDVSFSDVTLRPSGGDELNLFIDSPYMDPYIPDIDTPFNSRYNHKPTEFSVYFQDKIEYESMIINIGLRMDHFRPDGVVLADPSDPNIFIPLKPENRYDDKNGNGIEDPGETYTTEEKSKFWYEDATDKTQFSPRLGVSFPVTETGVIHFSYGHFFQLPVFELLYRNPQFKLGSGTGNQGIIGNADLKPEQTISGEIGLQQQVGSRHTMDFTVYFRDIRDLTGTRADEIVIFGGSATYNRLVNSDFGFVKGIILSLKTGYRQGFNYTIDYTFQLAKGTASDPNQARDAVASGNLPEVQLVPLGWDQLHTLNGTVSYVGQTWGFSFIGLFGSGLPYTPRKTDDVSAFRENSGSKPMTTKVDMRLHKEFFLSDQYRLMLWLRVFNLLDTRNETDVYDDTGRATFTTDLERIRSLNPTLNVNSLDEWYANESWYSEPRRIELGLTFNF